METREELLNGLNDAESLIKQLSNIQQRLTQVRNQYRHTMPNKKMAVFVKVIMGLCILNMLMRLFLVSGVTIWDRMWGILFGVLETAAVYYAAKFYYKWTNQKIDNQNKQIALNNENIKQQEQAVLNDLQQVQIAYNERISWWYPDSYCYVDAVEFFNNAVKNRRADNIKEAINLYETVLHQRRVEDNQKQALEQQKLNNLLAAGSLVMQGAALGEMSRHNATREFEMQQANRTLDNINMRLHR